MTKLSVAVIGAGMGGMATAAALQRAGIEANVYEQASSSPGSAPAFRSAAMP